MIFTDRRAAGEELAKKLRKYSGKAVVYGLPRGGVVTAAPVARELEAPLDLILVRKIGHPAHEEYAIGAIAENQQPVLNKLELPTISSQWLKNTIDEKTRENERRRETYFPKKYHPPSVHGKIAIIIDDGIATGLTMIAAVKAIKARKPKKVIVAVPVAPDDTIEQLRETADEVIVLDDPANFRGAVGAHYLFFPQIEDKEVIELLSEFL